MYIVNIFLPLFSFILLSIGSNFFGRKGSAAITVGNMFIVVLCAFMNFFEINLSGLICNIGLFDWILLGLFNISFGLVFDSLSVLMIFLVSIISFLVHIYSYEYMGNDPSLPRFMGYLSLFTFFMLFLVTADNVVQMFIGWEGVGLASYLLINFWYMRLLANKAGLKSMILNRVGDFGILMGILFIYCFFGSLNYGVIFSLMNYIGYETFIFLNYNMSIISVISLFLFLGAMAKSAQFGLHTWLPDAMEGPTPVSALIHAATMVTAGVFLIIRCSFIFEFSGVVLVIITFIGSITCLFFSIVGSFQYDLKKIIAYSTCSQLGYMVFSCGLSNYFTSIFHLFNHGFFKALLFLSAGAVIHAVQDEQDIRRMGGLINFLPLTYTCFIVGSLAIMGFPFLSGFYSKEFLLEYALGKFTSISLFSYALGLGAAFFTAFYSVKILYWVFITTPNLYKSIIRSIHEPGFLMAIPLVLLAFMSIFVGYLFSIVHLDLFFWNNSIYIFFNNNFIFEAEFILSPFLKLLPILVTFIGIVVFFTFNTNVNQILLGNIMIRLYKFSKNDTYKVLYIYSRINYNYILNVDLYRNSFNIIVIYFMSIHRFFGRALYFDYIFIYFLNLLFRLSYFNQKLFDRGVFEPLYCFFTIILLKLYYLFLRIPGLFFDYFVYMLFFLLALFGGIILIFFFDLYIFIFYMGLFIFMYTYTYISIYFQPVLNGQLPYGSV